MNHIPVLKEKVLEFLCVRENGIYVDGTCGGGGHSRYILEENDSVRLIGIDKDKKAVQDTAGKLECFDNFRIVHGGFENLKELLNDLNVTEIDGILLDLGFSTNQIESQDRGFSFVSEGPLDMRYDTGNDVTAGEILNNWSRTDLIWIFQQYGEINRPERIVGRILERRKRKKFETTTDFSTFICRFRKKRGKIHPATLFFQALRIAVNSELSALKNALSQAEEILKPSGRLLIISFHSLEDRIVKKFFANSKELKIVTKKPIVPDAAEIRRNPKSRSAKLRVAEKI